MTRYEITRQRLVKTAADGLEYQKPCKNQRTNLLRYGSG